MPSSSEYEALRERYLRLRAAAGRVIEAADYALDGADETCVTPLSYGTWNES